MRIKRKVEKGRRRRLERRAMGVYF
jgi:hypothetical protein